MSKTHRGQKTFLGKKHTEEWKQKMREINLGEKNPRWGKKHTEEWKEQKSKLSKGINTWSKGRILSDEHKRKIRENSPRGENSPNWIDGRSFLPYSKEFNENIKKHIRKIDNYICQGCWKSEEEEIKEFNCRLPIHHIDYNKNNCDFYNLITTCRSCNSKANKNREYWVNFYKSIVYDYPREF